MDKDYKKLYIKYKTKYFELKGGSRELLYQQFIGNNLIKNISDGIIDEPIEPPHMGAASYNTPPPKIRTPNSRLRDYALSWTPFLSPKSQSQAHLDDGKIEEQELSLLNSDPDYVPVEKRGKYIEEWLSEHLVCPCCNGNRTLRMYANPNMPVIDLVCINPDHTPAMGVRFFQVKTSSLCYRNLNIEIDESAIGMTYFSYNEMIDNNCFIHVGSRNFGQFVHSIKPLDEDKRLLIGYICVCYHETETDIIINKIKSFFVLPKIINDRLLKKDNWYYKYKDGHSPIIYYNKNTNSILKFDDSYHINIRFTKLAQILPNPLLGL